MIDEIANAQRKYFKTHATLNVKTRINYLKKLKAAILEREQEICSALKADLGKSPSESYMSEIGMVLEDLSCHIKNLKKWSKRKKKSSPLAQFPSSCYQLPSPYGCVLVISPWNYPFLLAMQPLIGAIGAGNTVVLKPSRSSDSTSNVLKELIAGVFPPELAVCFYDGTDRNGEITSCKFDYVFFTGGKSAGKAVYEAAAKFLTPVTLELGGKSPAIIDKSAKPDLAAKRVVFGKFLNVGQTCVAPDYVVAHADVADEFVKSLIKYIKKMYPDALNNDGYGKIINQRHFKRVSSLIVGNIVYGGKTDEESLKIEPTVIYPAATDAPAMQEEIFGPVLPVLTYNTTDELTEIIEKHGTPLALYLFSEKRKIEKKVLSEIPFGGGCVNDTVIHIATTSLPFGGVGESGTGSYHGYKSFETFSHYKSVLKKSTFIDLPIRYAPYTKFKDKLIRFFMK